MKDDRQIRKEILLNKDNVIILANAGSGKTTIMTNKMKADLNNNKSHYTVAAVTLMNKAVKEIREKLGKSYPNVFVGTNDSFVEKEIILPFVNDVYPGAGNLIVDYNRGFSSYEEGINLIKNESTIGVYEGRNNKGNFKFDLALKILENSEASSQYIKAKYFKIFIDEYQDSDQSMHRLFMWMLDNLNIKLFIVGDEKQSIYKWRGAYPENFVALATNKKFNYYQITRNFRSHIDIQNFSNSLNPKTCDDIEVQESVHNVCLTATEENMTQADSIIKLIESNHLDINKEITVLINNNAAIKEFVTEINEYGYEFSFIPRTPIDGNYVNGVFLRELATFYFNENYNEYDLIESSLGEYTANNVIQLERILKKFNIETVNVINLVDVIIELFVFFEITIDMREVQALEETLKNAENRIAFNNDKIKHKVMTVFSSKGLEFDQVISFSDYYIGRNDYGEVRRWEDHYVCVTRAKEQLIMVVEDVEYVLEINKIIKENTEFSLQNFVRRI